MSRFRALALLSAAGTLAFVVAVPALHVLQAELDPVSVTVSEYVLGPGGWLFTAGCAAWGLGSLALAALLAGTGRSRGGAALGTGRSNAGIGSPAGTGRSGAGGGLPAGVGGSGAGGGSSAGAGGGSRAGAGRLLLPTYIAWSLLMTGHATRDGART
ncbi:DUF998 domain-containing protein [Nonomuraea sp. NPDC049309]|uniref:DUF998 domain-containing protein n=1 Tax=Nonomuraea sp. NPDC049309 TaxID=3364350 RepID=UPI00371B48CC